MGTSDAELVDQLTQLTDAIGQLRGEVADLRGAVRSLGVTIDNDSPGGLIQVVADLVNEIGHMPRS